MNQARHYLSYLLRLWQERDADRPVWRASLERPGGEELKGFAGPEELFNFLQEQLKGMDEAPDAAQGEEPL